MDTPGVFMSLHGFLYLDKSLFEQPLITKYETSLNRQLQYNLEEVKTRSYKKHRRQIPDLKGENGGERYIVCEYIC